jgi:hypothetical protein
MQHRRGKPDPGQLGNAQMPNDRRVGKQEERLGDQGAKSWNSKPEDFTAVALGFWGGNCSGRRLGHGFSLTGTEKITTTH